MSKINQIQSELKAIDPARFQKLCDLYLHKRGYERINPLGLVIGTDKVTQGTPDSLIALPSGNYVFAEYTTQQSNIFEKFLADLSKCFDKAKTGVPIEQIQEIILCHNSKLTAGEELALTDVCQKHSCLLSIFGIGPISHDLYQKYPGLAREFLDVTVDTNQIIDLEDFVTAYSKSKFAAPLDTAFHFRENEVEQITKALEQNNLVIITGRAGVGKSRLALECCEQFVKSHLGFKIQCLFNRGPDLFEDLRVYFTPPGSYLIFVDDANRINKFDYVVQWLLDQSEDRKIKVIATVRDYALDRVREVAGKCGGRIEFELHPLTDEQIKELVSDVYGIRNHFYLDRITDIAKGNPRLAVMAARVAKQSNSLQSISNVSALYDEYFSSIKQDVNEVGDKNLLRIAGIVTFFRVVDRSNSEIMRAITDAFGISYEDFWLGAQNLHELEVFDMYEKEIVKASDQVLATYLFYLAFFRERVLHLSTLLTCFFPRFKRRLIDVLNPLLSIFGDKALLDEMRPQVESAWTSLEKADDKLGLLN